MRPGPLRAGRMSAARAALAVLLALGVAACAPTLRAPSGIDSGTLAMRYERLRAAREARLVAARMEVTAWIGGDSFGRLPAVQLDVALASPDHVRARIGSLFGTAIDLMVRGDSMTGYVPPRRVGFEVASLEESLGVRLPGAWACRSLGADWRPVEARWVKGTGDTLWRVAWIEGADSLAMSLRADGLPVAVEMRASAGRRLAMRYVAWSWTDGVPWPARLEFTEGSGAFHADMRVDRVRFLDRPDPLWMALAIPPAAGRLDWAALRDALSRLGGSP